MTETAWIAVDWGTSHLRAWSMQGNRMRAEATSDAGMATLERADFEPALLALVADWLDGPTDVLACGMVGSRQGWQEAPYSAVPCAPLGASPVGATCADPRLRVHLVPGLKQARPADVMRGEETQIAGFLAHNSGWDGVICLPGTHTKWAHVSAGEVVSFQTFMSGELYCTLARHSVLRHSLAGAGWDPEAFAEGLSDGMARPERLAARLFGLRAADLLENTSADANRARLSGLLIGAELVAARPYWLGQQVALVGSPEVTEPYQHALGTQAVPTQIADGAEMVRAGLAVAYDSLRQTA
jgi:2-dehydro-3-deoxygalactonokinase